MVQALTDEQLMAFEQLDRVGVTCWVVDRIMGIQTEEVIEPSGPVQNVSANPFADLMDQSEMESPERVSKNPAKWGNKKKGGNE